MICSYLFITYLFSFLAYKSLDLFTLKVHHGGCIFKEIGIVVYAYGKVVLMVKWISMIGSIKMIYHSRS